MRSLAQIVQQVHKKRSLTQIVASVQRQRRRASGGGVELLWEGPIPGLMRTGQRYLDRVRVWPEQPTKVGFTYSGQKLRVDVTHVEFGIGPDGQTYVTEGVILFPAPPPRFVRAWAQRTQGQFGPKAQITTQDIVVASTSGQLQDYLIDHQLGQPGFSDVLPYNFRPRQDVGYVLDLFAGQAAQHGLAALAPKAFLVTDKVLAVDLESEDGLRRRVDAVRLAALVRALGAKRPADRVQIEAVAQRRGMQPIRVTGPGGAGYIAPRRIS